MCPWPLHPAAHVCAAALGCVTCLAAAAEACLHPCASVPWTQTWPGGAAHCICCSRGHGHLPSGPLYHHHTNDCHSGRHTGPCQPAGGVPCDDHHHRRPTCQGCHHLYLGLLVVTWRHVGAPCSCSCFAACRLACPAPPPPGPSSCPYHLPYAATHHEQLPHGLCDDRRRLLSPLRLLCHLPYHLAACRLCQAVCPDACQVDQHAQQHQLPTPHSCACPPGRVLACQVSCHGVAAHLVLAAACHAWHVCGVARRPVRSHCWCCCHCSCH